jgi:hypothetical protein
VTRKSLRLACLAAKDTTHSASPAASQQAVGGFVSSAPSAGTGMRGRIIAPDETEHALVYNSQVPHGYVGAQARSTLGVSASDLQRQFGNLGSSPMMAPGPRPGNGSALHDPQAAE